MVYLLIINLLVFLIIYFGLKLLSKKRQERANEISKQQTRFQAAINSINVGFIVADLKGEIVTINAAAKSILCSNNPSSKPLITNPSLVNLKCSMSDIEARLSGYFDIKSQIDKCLKEKRSINIEALPYKGLFLHIHIDPIVDVKKHQGLELDFIGTVILVEDITDEIVLERSKQDFFSIASHELKTPLAVIKGNSEIVKKYFLDQIKNDRFKVIIDDIHKSSVNLIDIVNDFLDLSRLEQGRMRFNTVAFPIKPLIEEVIQGMQPLAKAKNIYLKLEKDMEQSLVLADKDRVRQILINLVSNALKFTEKGGVTVFTAIEGKFLKLSVQDSGCGISYQNKKLIFKKFQLATDNTLTRSTGRNTGVGLYISKLITEGMGGTIQLESSEINKGSIFSFTIPLQEG